MIATRRSTAKEKSKKIKLSRRKKGEGNSAWIERNLQSKKDWNTVVFLAGGSDLASFRVRVAQSHARQDLLPSFWSHCGILRRAKNATSWKLWEAALNPASGFAEVPKNNGVRAGDLAAYDDPKMFPNVAYLRFALGQADLEAAIERFRYDRATLDVPGLIVEWLAYVWGVADHGNPLLRGLGVPAAAFVEGAYALAGLEVTPGLSSQSSCPEAIWQAASWWHLFYESEVPMVQQAPEGYYVIDQPAAAIVE
jgi:hypothetical protein